MIKTTSLSLYIINQVLLKRLVKGITARQLSLTLEHGESYVSKVEDIFQVNTYPPHEWPKLAVSLQCEIIDFLPPEQSESTGGLVDKRVLSLFKKTDVKKVIAALREHGFFREEKTLEEVAKYLNIQDENQIAILEEVMTEELL